MFVFEYLSLTDVSIGFFDKFGEVEYNFTPILFTTNILYVGEVKETSSFMICFNDELQSYNKNILQ